MKKMLVGVGVTVVLAHGASALPVPVADDKTHAPVPAVEPTALHPGIPNPTLTGLLCSRA